MGSPNLLIVDDEASFRAVLENLLVNSGYTCVQAADAGEARSLLAREPVDLILCDIQMPGESGLELIRWVKKEYPDLAIIMVTGIDDPQEARVALEIGVYGYIIKPFERNQILISIINALRRRELEAQGRSYRENLEQEVWEKTRDLKLLVELLKEGESQYRSLVEGSIQGILIHRDLKPVFVNQALAKIHGYSLAETLRLESIIPLIAPQEQARLLGYREARLRGDPAPVHYEYQGVRKDGSLIWLSSRVTVVQWEGTLAIQLTVADITSRKEGEAALKESEELFRAISDSAQAAIIMMDQDGKISYWNKAAETIFGYTHPEALGQVLHRFIVPERFLEPHQKAFETFQKTGRGPAIGQNLELMALRKGGEEFPIELSLSSVNMKGSWQAVGIIRDISSRKAAEDSVRRAHQEMAALISGISSVLIGLSDAGCIIQWNRQAEETFDIPTGDALGRPVAELGIHWERGRIEEGMAHCRNQRKIIRIDDVRFTRPDGKEGFLGITLNPILTDDGRLFGLLLMGADQTEKKILQMQLSQAQKLESIGQLAAGIAHEINTPIQYVGDNTRFLNGAFTDLLGIARLYDRLLEAAKREMPSSELIPEIEKQIRKVDLNYLEEEIPQAIEQTLEGVERVSRIVLSMKEFSHPGTNKKTAVNINRALENTITVARNEWKYVAELETDLDPNLPPVPCIPGEINQVFLNILVNAAQAIGETAQGGEGPKGIIHIRTRQINGDAEIRISDNGPGIPPAIRDRIFDPFFTTKEPGKGSGQGLAIAHTAVVRKHSGSIQVESEEGIGTNFIIRLPLEAEGTAGR
jgi:two-component system, NtrC family, sensor kinase